MNATDETTVEKKKLGPLQTVWGIVVLLTASAAIGGCFQAPYHSSYHL